MIPASALASLGRFAQQDSLPGLPDGVGWGVLVLLLLAALAGGFVDAVVGGGGLIQLPALLLVPGLSPVQALATNKLAAIAGTATSSLTFYRKVRPSLRETLPIAVFALTGAIGGASLAASLAERFFTPIIVVALVVVALITLLKPDFGIAGHAGPTGVRAGVIGAAIGLGIGVYDGLLGPGTGTFIVFALVGVLGHDFLQASARAKIVNFATNLGALVFFVPNGAVIWMLGALMAVANIAGSFIGARLAIARGVKFIRALFLIVVTALIVRLAVKVFTG